MGRPKKSDFSMESDTQQAISLIKENGYYATQVITYKGDKVISKKTGDFNPKAIALEELKILLVHLFYYDGAPTL